MEVYFKAAKHDDLETALPRLYCEPAQRRAHLAILLLWRTLAADGPDYDEYWAGLSGARLVWRLEGLAVFNDFYAALAQVLPVLLLALIWDSSYLARLRGERRRPRRVDPSGVWFWTKSRVRMYTMTVATVLVAGTGIALFVLAGLIPDSLPLRVALAAGLGIALATLLFRVWVDILLATARDGASSHRRRGGADSPAQRPLDELPRSQATDAPTPSR